MALPKHLWLVLLIVFAVYAPSLGNGYAIDAGYLARPTLPDGGPQPVMHQLHGPVFYFGKNYWAGTGIYDGLYRPVTIYSFALTNHLLGAGGTAHHVVDLLLHLLAVVLVFRFARRWTAGDGGALAAALTFGLLAIHHEAVASIVGRAEILSVVFGLGAMLLYGTSRAGHVACAVLLFLAFCTKESGLAWIAFLPCTLIALRVAGREAPGWKALPLVVLPGLLAWYLLRDAALAPFEHIPREIDNLKNPLAHVDTTTRLLTAVKIWGYGLYKTVVGYPQSYIYGMGAFGLVTSLGNPGFLAATVALLALVGVGVLGLRKRPLVFLAVAALLGFSFIASNIPVVAGTVFAERLYYAPSIGLCLLVAAFWPGGAPAPWLWRATLGVYLALQAAVILARNPQWADEEQLIRADIHAQPEAADILDKLSSYQFNDKPQDLAGALASIDRALQVYPEFPTGLWKKATSALSAGDQSGALRLYASACHSPYVRMPLRITLQRQLESLLFRPPLAQRDAAGMTQAVQAQAAYAASFVAGIERAYQIPGFPQQNLQRMVAAGLKRFPQDALLRIHQGILRAQQGMESPETAQEILDLFTPGLWRIPDSELVTPTFVRATLIAATAFAKTGRTRTATTVIDKLMGLPNLPPAVRRQAAAARREILSR